MQELQQLSSHQSQGEQEHKADCTTESRIYSSKSLWIFQTRRSCKTMRGDEERKIKMCMKKPQNKCPRIIPENCL